MVKKNEKYIIGDLVIWEHYWSKRNYVAEIIEIGETQCYIRFSPSKGFSGIEGNIRLKTLKPIPLTMEILEHNGFTVGNYNEWSNPKCDFLHFVIDSLDENKWSVYARRAEDEVQLTTIKYVHELQHLLFGLDINIKIEINESL